jgi:hypothetical protein
LKLVLSKDGCRSTSRTVNRQGDAEVTKTLKLEDDHRKM